MHAIVAVIQDSGLTFGEVVRGIPHDAASVVVYAMLLVFCAFIWLGSRRRVP
jgi:uncharacterized protein (TIGR03382 family)